MLGNPQKLLEITPFQICAAASSSHNTYPTIQEAKAQKYENIFSTAS